MKAVAVAHERWTWKLLVFWKTGCRGEVVACERWLQLEVPLYSVVNAIFYRSNEDQETSILGSLTI